MPTALRGLIREHRLRQGRAGRGLVFGRSQTQPFNPTSAQQRARAAWEAHELASITMHECRHTFASLMIAAGVNDKALSTYMGHANIAIAMDRYGKLMPGNEQHAAGLLDSYLDAAVVVRRVVIRPSGIKPGGHRPRERRAALFRATSTSHCQQFEWQGLFPPGVGRLGASMSTDLPHRRCRRSRP